MSITKTREVFSLPNAHYAYFYYFDVFPKLGTTVFMRL